MQQIYLQPIDHDDDLTVKGIPSRLSSTLVVNRLELLHLQQQWVADDEFAYYLRMIATTGRTSVAPICVLPPGLDDADTQHAVQRWIQNACFQAVDRLTSITALLVEGHWMPAVIHQQAMGLNYRGHHP